MQVQSNSPQLNHKRGEWSLFPKRLTLSLIRNKREWCHLGTIVYQPHWHACRGRGDIGESRSYSTADYAYDAWATWQLAANMRTSLRLCDSDHTLWVSKIFKGILTLRSAWLSMTTYVNTKPRNVGLGGRLGLGCCPMRPAYSIQEQPLYNMKHARGHRADASNEDNDSTRVR